ncbi:MAG: hypothetical protein Q9187_002776 [Circinaria calcarea]
MTASIPIYSLSFEKLKTLHRSAQDMVTLTLPARPSHINPDQYLDSAISILSESAVSLYSSQRYLDSRSDKIETQLKKTGQKVETHLEKTDWKVDSHFAYLNRRLDKGFEEVGRRFDEVEKGIREIGEWRESMDQWKEGVDQRFDEAKAINFNRLTKSLHAHIRKVAASIQDENGRIRYEVAPGFPRTIK